MAFQDVASNGFPVNLSRCRKQACVNFVFNKITSGFNSALTSRCHPFVGPWHTKNWQLQEFEAFRFRIVRASKAGRPGQRAAEHVALEQKGPTQRWHCGHRHILQRCG